MGRAPSPWSCAAPTVRPRGADGAGGAGGGRARLRSVGVNCDARHPTAPDAEGSAG
ncbi:hypothetical protein NKH77_47960 [Streptomyces sp. M19]